MVYHTLGLEAKEEKEVLASFPKIAFGPNNDIFFTVGLGWPCALEVRQALNTSPHNSD